MGPRSRLARLPRRLRQRLDEATARFAEALRLNPDFIDARLNLGIALSRQGRLEEARAQLAEAIRLKPDSANAHTNLGSVLYQQGRLEEARAQYAEAIRLKPDSADAVANLGSVLHREGRLEEALARYEEAARLAPNNAIVHNNRARIWATSPDAKNHDGRRAVESATRACELTMWNNVAFLDTLAAASAEAGDFASAVKWQTRAIDLLTDLREKEDFRTRFELYRQRRLYREPGVEDR